MSLFRCGVTRYCPRLKDKEPEQDEPVSGVTGGFEFIEPVIICIEWKCIVCDPLI